MWTEDETDTIAVHDPAVLGVSSVFAEAGHEAELLDAICAEEQLPLEEALGLLGGEAGQTPQGTALRQTCEALAMREGLFVQKGRSSKGKVYTAKIEFYLQKRRAVLFGGIHQLWRQAERCAHGIHGGWRIHDASCR